MTLLPAVSWSSNLPGQEDYMPKLFLDVSVLTLGRCAGACGTRRAMGTPSGASALNLQAAPANIYGCMLRR
jgi:hypothetical protein